MSTLVTSLALTSGYHNTTSHHMAKRVHPTARTGPIFAWPWIHSITSVPLLCYLVGSACQRHGPRPASWKPIYMSCLSRLCDIYMLLDPQHPSNHDYSIIFLENPKQQAACHEANMGRPCGSQHGKRCQIPKARTHHPRIHVHVCSLEKKTN